MKAGAQTPYKSPLAADPARSTVYDVERIRQDFPALRQQINGRPLIYLDNAATSQKPKSVIDAVVHFYSEDCSNIHRGVHELSMRATQAYEDARRKIQLFLNAASKREIVFVRGATEGINLVAQSWARPRLRAGDDVVISHMEHHSNIVPWQIVCEQTGAKLRVVPINDEGEFLFEDYEKILSSRTKVVAVGHVSNALGTINPIKRIVAAAHAINAVVLVDGAQAAPHMKLDVHDLGVDFYAVSGHKMYGPTGVGVLYGKEELLEAMPPYQGGGDMIRSVSFEKTLYNELPFKFEAGTPNIAGGIGLGAAVDYLDQVDLEAAAIHEDDVLAHATGLLREIPGLRLFGTAREKAAVLSFTLEGIHPHDTGTILDQEGIAVRTGHHCAQPVMERFGVAATARASFGLYNTRQEAEALAEGIHKVRQVFGA